ncbi:MAG: hypothetical protein P8130_05265 [Deltaproteobacteria bacterium]
MDEDERKVQTILAFTFKKMAEELTRPDSEKSSQALDSHAKHDGKKRSAENFVRRGAEWP